MIPIKGDKVLINGKEYTLGAKLGGGLEGNIFDVKDFPNYVIKIINDEKMTVAQRNEAYQHLKWLYDFCSRKKEISQRMAVPKALLDNELGYIMRKANEHYSLKEYITDPEDINDFENWYKNDYTLKKRYQIIVNLFGALREIHLSGLIFTDLSPNNIMVHKKQNQIVFVDTDNIRNRMDSYLGVLGTPGYMAPEIYRKPNAELAKQNNIDFKILSNCGRITPESDIFSAAIIAFQLLTLQHPFIGDEVEEGEPELEEKALEIKTDYIFKEGTTNNSTYKLTPVFNEITTHEIRKLFYRTFVEGKDYPALRPTDEEFLEAFQNALDLIVECPDCGFSRLYLSDNENCCINCNKPFKSKVTMIIYNVFKNLKRDEVINNIGNYPQYDISIDGLRSCEGSIAENYIETARVILEPGESKAKFLYLRHFEKNTQRSKKYARITLSDSCYYVSIEILNNVFENSLLIEKSTGKIIPLNQGKEFPLDRYGVIFDTQKHGNGFIQIFGEFIKG